MEPVAIAHSRKGLVVKARAAIDLFLRVLDAKDRAATVRSPRVRAAKVEKARVRPGVHVGRVQAAPVRFRKVPAEKARVAIGPFPRDRAATVAMRAPPAHARPGATMAKVVQRVRVRPVAAANLRVRDAPPALVGPRASS